MMWAILAPAIACLSCSHTGGTPRMPAPAYPLCLVEEVPHKHILDRIGNITPAPITQALLVPFFMAPNRQRFVACPFVYQPGGPVVLPKDRMPKQAQYEGIIVLCRGHLPTNINTLFPTTDTINGKKCQLIELASARNDEESLRILDDWATLLKSESFSVTDKFHVLKQTQPAKGRYATSKELLYPLRNEYTSFFVWPYDVGTAVKVELTPRDKALVNEFITQERRQISPKEEQGRDKRK